MSESGRRSGLGECHSSITDASSSASRSGSPSIDHPCNDSSSANVSQLDNVFGDDESGSRTSSDNMFPKDIFNDDIHDNSLTDVFGDGNVANQYDDKDLTLQFQSNHRLLADKDGTMKGLVQTTSNASATLKFLNLPGEIRNNVYKWILPRAECPSIIQLHWHSTQTERSLPTITTEIYRTCKTIYRECPSLEILLMKGAIIPALYVTCRPSVPHWWTHLPSEQLLNQTLPAASRLRIYAKGIFDTPRSQTRLLEWVQCPTARQIMETFLSGNWGNPLVSLNKHDKIIEIKPKGDDLEMLGDQYIRDYRKETLCLLLRPVASKMLLYNLTSVCVPFPRPEETSLVLEEMDEIIVNLIHEGSQKINKRLNQYMGECREELVLER